jgi:hypothetical protein
MKRRGRLPNPVKKTGQAVEPPTPKWVDVVAGLTIAQRFNAGFSMI